MKPEKKAKNVKKGSKKNSILRGNNILILGLAGIILIAGIVYSLADNPDRSGPDKKSMTLKEARALIDEEYTKKGLTATYTPPVVDDYVPVLAPRSLDGEVKLPSYAYTSALTLKAYRFATEHPEILEQIPCYCGCGGHNGHKSLRYCFINDNGTYDDHASFCDICVGEAIKVQDYLGTSLASPVVNPPVAGVDLSQYSLTEGFDSIEDGLKLTPAGANRAYFINIKLLTGTAMEDQYVASMSRDVSFYGKKVIGMFSADFSPDSWIELHDLGYDNTKDATLGGKIELGMKNTVYTRPLIYGHSQNVDNVMKLMTDPNSTATSYPAYRPLLDAVDFQNTGIAMVLREQTGFSDMSYWSLSPVNGSIELVHAYNITDTDAVPDAFDRYDPQIRENILIIKVTGDLATVQKEKDNIDAAARV